MRTSKYYLISSILFALLSVPAFGQTKSSLPEDFRPLLIGHANLELSRIDLLKVTILPAGAKAGKGDPLWKELEAKAENKLEDAGLRTTETLDYRYESRSLHIPELKIHIGTFKLEDSQQYIFLIQTALARPVYLAHLPQAPSPPDQVKWTIKAGVWEKSSEMQAVSVQDMPAKVTNVVMDQVEVFIMAWRAANPPDKQTSDTGDISPTKKEPTSQAAETSTVAYKYVASKNSKVFHVPNCRFANQISSKNLVGYKSRDDAINAGKRPCKVCKP
jgi:hypothetical protein